MTPIFNHTGSLGDIVYSLYFVRDLLEYLGEAKGDYHIQTGVRTGDDPSLHPNGVFGMTDANAEFIRPLLERIEFVREVSVSGEMPQNAVDIASFRKRPVNMYAGNIIDYQYATPALPLKREFWKPLLAVNDPDENVRGRIVVFYSKRYNNLNTDPGEVLNFLLERRMFRREDFLFIGYEEELRHIRADIPYRRPGSLYEVARIIAGAKLCIGNQTGFFSVAEILKAPRILASAEFFRNPQCGGNLTHGPCNVIPQGGRCAIARTSQELLDLTVNFMKML